MGSLIVLFVVAVTAAIVFAKGSIAKSLVLIVLTVTASAIAFNFYELLAGLFITKIPKMAPWAMAASFGLIFILALCLLGVATVFLLKQKIDFGTLPEQIGRPICGIILGMLFAGVLLTFLAMAPLPAKYPYARFEPANPNPGEAGKPIPNADGLVTGIFTLMSKGSFSGKQSFGVLHPDIIGQAYLNRHAGSDVPVVTKEAAISAPKKDGIWNAPEGLTDSEGQVISPKPGHTLMIARVSFNARAVAQAGKFTLSQLRMICKDRNAARDLFAGSGVNVYPIGYIEATNTVAKRKLNEVITFTRQEFGDQSTRFIDFAFNVPNGYVPVLIQFKANNVAQLSAPANPDQIPAPAPFKPGEAPPEGSAPKPDNSSARNPQNNKSNSGSGGASSKVGEMIYGDLEDPLQQ